MTYRHECLNCRWSVACFEEVRCCNPASGRKKVEFFDWCGKWENGGSLRTGAATAGLIRQEGEGDE